MRFSFQQHNIMAHCVGYILVFHKGRHQTQYELYISIRSGGILLLRRLVFSESIKPYPSPPPPNCHCTAIISDDALLLLNYNILVNKHKCCFQFIDFVLLDVSSLYVTCIDTSLLRFDNKYFHAYIVLVYLPRHRNEWLNTASGE